MATYRLSVEFIEKHRRRVRMILPILLLIVLSGSAAFRRGYAGEMFLVVPVIGVVLVFAMWRGFRRQTALAQSFELDVAPGRIVRTFEGFPTLTLRRDEVVRIERHPDGELSFHASDPKQSIRIPAGIERREELLRELEEWGPVESGRPVRSQGWGTAAAVLVVVAFAVTINSTNPLVVAIVGGLLIAALVTSSILLFRGGNPKFRRLALIALLPAIAVLVRIFDVLF